MRRFARGGVVLLVLAVGLPFPRRALAQTGVASAPAARNPLVSSVAAGSQRGLGAFLGSVPGFSLSDFTRSWLQTPTGDLIDAVARNVAFNELRFAQAGAVNLEKLMADLTPHLIEAAKAALATPGTQVKLPAPERAEFGRPGPAAPPKGVATPAPVQPVPQAAPDKPAEGPAKASPLAVARQVAAQTVAMGRRLLGLSPESGDADRWRPAFDQSGTRTGGPIPILSD